MAGIFPTSEAGGVLLPSSSVENGYVVGPDFTVTCGQTGLPSDCTAIMTPAQINAIMSEMVSFAECLSPAGTWDCGALNNLCAAFSEWIENSLGEAAASQLNFTDCEGAAIEVNAELATCADLQALSDDITALEDTINGLEYEGLDCNADTINLAETQLVTKTDLVAGSMGFVIPYEEGDGSLQFDPCAPATLVDPCLISLPLETTAPPPTGVTWRSEAGSPNWTRIGFSPRMQNPVSVVTDPSVFNLDDAYLTAEAGNGPQLLDTLILSYTNTDCVPVRLSYVTRTNIQTQIRGGSNGNVAINTSALTSAGFIATTATPAADYAADTGHVGFSRVNLPPIIGMGGMTRTTPIQPGETIQLAFDLFFTVTTHTPDPATFVRIGSNILLAEIWRSM